MEQYQCTNCNTNFGYRKNLIRHQKNCTSESNLRHVKCPDVGCDELFTRKSVLNKHLQSCHGVELINETFLFPSYEAFKIWQTKIQKENSCLYTVRSKHKKNERSVTYLGCHRSGFFSDKVNDHRKRKLKSQGSNRINSTCPSAMTLIEEKDGTFRVIYCSTHFGHDKSLNKVFLSEEERAVIAGRISEGVPLKTILEDVRSDEGYSNFARPLSIRDLRNIKRNLKCHEERKQSENVTEQDVQQSIFLANVRSKLEAALSALSTGEQPSFDKLIGIDSSADNILNLLGIRIAENVSETIIIESINCEMMEEIILDS